jgi:hypothetical protein
MGSRYGGVARWLTDHGFGPEDQRLLRAKIRDPADRRAPEGSAA